MEYKKFIELTKNRNPWIIVYPRISISSPVYKYRALCVYQFTASTLGRKSSERLQRELPGLRGFSSGNLKKMRILYEEWQCLSIGSPLANQLQQLENKIEEGVEIGEKTLLCINRPIESADLRIKTKQDMPEELQKALPDLDKMKDLYCKSL